MHFQVKARGNSERVTKSANTQIKVKSNLAVSAAPSSAQLSITFPKQGLKKTPEFEELCPSLNVIQAGSVDTLVKDVQGGINSARSS